MMKMIDYTGKLNNHEEYINVIKKIEDKCKYIEIVVIDGRKSNKFIDEFSDDILSVKKVSEWWGTLTKSVNNLYRIKATKEIFTYLRKYETFCKYYEYGSTKESFRRGDYSEVTDFGLDDIAFYDENNNCLLCTTTHEGYILINETL
ncbi:MAG: hypothetical protein E7165_01125 [Firmicutes bacterium]|nr:hypothetical protein [Bacillota bacterium]